MKELFEPSCLRQLISKHVLSHKKNEILNFQQNRLNWKPLCLVKWVSPQKTNIICFLWYGVVNIENSAGKKKKQASSNLIILTLIYTPIEPWSFYFFNLLNIMVMY